MSYFIEFEPVGRRGKRPEGEMLLESARQLGVGLSSLCGGIGGCGQCIVQIVDGEVSQPASEDAEYLSAEAIAKGYRLACQTLPLGDCKVRLPLERFRQVGNAAGMGSKMALISRAQRDAARALASRIGYLELAAHPHFSSTFAQFMLLG